jgi:hypothetical protein
MHDWKDYQFISDSSAERTRRYRQRRKKRDGDVTSNVTVTPYLPTNLQTKDLTNFETQEAYRAGGMSPEQPDYRSPPKSKSENMLERLPDQPQKSPRADIEAIKQKGRNRRNVESDQSVARE